MAGYAADQLITQPASSRLSQHPQASAPPLYEDPEPDPSTQTTLEEYSNIYEGATAPIELPEVPDDEPSPPIRNIGKSQKETAMATGTGTATEIATETASTQGPLDAMEVESAVMTPQTNGIIDRIEEEGKVILDEGKHFVEGLAESAENVVVAGIKGLGEFYNALLVGEEAGEAAEILAPVLAVVAAA
jgi:hypothetical protein